MRMIMKVTGIIDAEQDIFRQTYVATIAFYKKNFHGHLLSRTNAFPNHAGLFTERGSKLPVDNFGRDSNSDGLGVKVNDYLPDYLNVANKVNVERQPALPEHFRLDV